MRRKILEPLGEGAGHLRGTGRRELTVQFAATFEDGEALFAAVVLTEVKADRH
jgi:hypothetical protein